MSVKLSAVRISAKAKIHTFMALFFICNISSVAFSAQSYQKFNGEPTGDWDLILEKAGVNRYYSVQRGDNLYDISKTLFGSSDFWPKIWSLNSVITNPHVIEKGQVIYFSGGTVVAPPRFGMEILQPQTYVYGSGLLEPMIPPDPILNDAIPIPKTFVNYYKPASLRDQEAKKLESIATGLRYARVDKRKVLLTSEVTAKKPPYVGKLTRIQGGSYAAKSGSLVTIAIKSGEAQQGQILSIFSYTKKRFGPVTKDKKYGARLVEWLGEVKILNQINNDEYLAEVRNANDLITVGSYISAEKIRRIQLPNRTGSILSKRPSLGVQVIGASKASGVQAAGEGQVVYLKGGSLKGVEENKVYPLFDNFGIGMHVESSTKYIQKSLGFVKIGKVEPKFATGVIFNLSKEVSSETKLSL